MGLLLETGYFHMTEKVMSCDKSIVFILTPSHCCNHFSVSVWNIPQLCVPCVLHMLCSVCCVCYMCHVVCAVCYMCHVVCCRWVWTELADRTCPRLDRPAYSWRRITTHYCQMPRQSPQTMLLTSTIVIDDARRSVLPSSV